jgi:hypothetical protein
LLVPAPGDFSVVRPRYVKAFALLP